MTQGKENKMYVRNELQLRTKTLGRFCLPEQIFCPTDPKAWASKGEPNPSSVNLTKLRCQLFCDVFFSHSCMQLITYLSIQFVSDLFSSAPTEGRGQLVFIFTMTPEPVPPILLPVLWETRANQSQKDVLLLGLQEKLDQNQRISEVLSRES